MAERSGSDWAATSSAAILPPPSASTTARSRAITPRFSSNGVVTIEDLDSKNGTFVGGLPINFANLEDGRDFSVGAVRLVYRRTQLGLSTATFAAES